MQTTSSIRIRGGILVVCGGLLVPFMGYLAVWMTAAFRDHDGLHASFKGTQEQMLMIIALIGMLILFGVMAFVTGSYFLIFGRRNKWFVRSVACIGSGLFLIGIYFLWTSP
ncbi:MAG: hypothetical protein ABJA02_01615 [Acidobacteriota bacterium]